MNRNIFSRNPIKMIDGMYDFIGDYSDDYIINYDEIAEGVRDWQHLRTACSGQNAIIPADLLPTGLSGIQAGLSGFERCFQNIL